MLFRSVLSVTGINTSTVKTLAVSSSYRRETIPVNGTPVTLTTTVPKGTARNTRFDLGNDLQVFDRVLDVYVTPGTNLTRISNGPILWDIYDLITVETTP